MNPRAIKSADTEYPKRPPYFANKACRLLAKKTVANEIGSTACWLLTVIAMTEDARGYTDAVTYYNEQLLPLIGVGSVDALDRVRRKVVGAGWLNYTPGRKGVPGRYFVTIPDRYKNTDDGPSDESHLDEGGEYLRENAEGSAERTAREVRKEPREKCGTLLPVPSPVPSSAAEAAGVIAKDQTPEKQPKTAPKEKKPLQRNPLFDAISEVTGSDPATAGSHIGKVSAALASADPPYTPDEVREFGRRFGELCPWAARDHRTRPELGELQKHIGKLRAAAPQASNRLKGAADNPFLNDEALREISPPMSHYPPAESANGAGHDC